MNTRHGVCCVLLCVQTTILHAQWGPALRFTVQGSAQSANTWSISSSFGGMVHVVWTDTRDVNPAIYYRRSTDYGYTWENEVRFIETGDSVKNPGVSIAGVMNPVVHVVWEDNRHGNKEIYYRRSSDWGVTWSGDTRLTDSPGASTQPNLHGCVCCGADVRIVWIEHRPGNSEIFYKFSNDNGFTWSEDICITSQESAKEHPNLSFCRDDVQIIWTDNANGKSEIWGSHSTDCGMTWSPAVILSQQEHVWAGYPVIAHVDSTYHVMWTAQADSSDPSGNGVYYRRTEVLGLSWSPIERIVVHKELPLPFASCFAMKKNLHLAWGIPSQGLYYKRSTDNGLSWGETSSLEEPGGIWNPCVAISGTCVHVVWFEENSAGTDIYYRHNPTGNPVGQSK